MSNTCDIPSSPMFIVSKFNGRVMDVEKGSVSDGAKIIVWTKKDDPDNKNQLWKYEDGCFVNLNNGKFLDFKGDKIQPEACLIQNSKVGNEKQRWVVDKEGYIHLQSNPDLVCDIKKQEDKDGAEVILYPKRQGAVTSNQQWELQPHYGAFTLQSL